MLSSEGETLNLPNRTHYGYQDLVVFGVNSACEAKLVLFTWSGSAYQIKSEENCKTCEDVSKKDRTALCSSALDVPAINLE